jgi:hypothetical protein
MTPAFLRRARARDGLDVEFVPIAPKRAVDPKRFVSSRSKRVSRTSHWQRTLTEQDQRDVIVTPVFASNPGSDDDNKKTGPVAMNMGAYYQGDTDN